MEEINISDDSFINHETEVIAAYNECMKTQADLHREIEKLRRLRDMETTAPSRQSNAIVTSASSVAYAVSDSTSDCKLDRWTYIAEQLCDRLLSAQKEKSKDKEAKEKSEEKPGKQEIASEEGKIEIQLDRTMLEQLFKNFCVFGTSELRRQVGKLVKKQLNMKNALSWKTFLSDTLQSFFSTQNAPVSPLNLFPLNEVYSLLQDVMSQDKQRFLYLNDLFKLLETMAANPNPDLCLVAWVLSLLSNNLAITMIIHPNSKCHGCGMTPIRGVR